MAPNQSLSEKVINLLESDEPIPPELRDRVHLALLLDIQQQVTELSDAYEEFKKQDRVDKDLISKQVSELRRYAPLLWMHKHPKATVLISVASLTIIKIIISNEIGRKFLLWLIGASFLSQ